MRSTSVPVLVGLLLFASAARADIDPTFGSGGVATATVADGDAYRDPVSIAVQTDGKIVVATREGAGDFAIFRFDAGGTLDATFGVAGKSLIDLGGDDTPNGIVIRPTGEIVVAGRSTSGPDERIAMVQLLAGGSLDPSFGALGLVVDDLGARVWANDVTLDALGNLLVGGEHRTLYGSLLARYDASGALDATFGAGGVHASNDAILPGGQTWIQSVSIQADGKILACGSGWTFTDPDPPFGGAAIGYWLMYRFLPDGSPDPTFATAGLQSTLSIPLPGGEPLIDCRGIVPLPSGDLLAVGQNDDGYGFSSLRLTPLGALDPSWGDAGLLETLPFARPPLWPIVPDPARARTESIRHEASGAFTLIGPGAADYQLDWSALAIRYLPDGTHDPAWGVGGIVEIPGFGSDLATASARAPDGTLLLATRSGGDVELRRVIGYVPCGNGVVEPWEDCDDANTDDGDCCSSTCSFEPIGSPCPDDGNTCTTDTCDAAGACDHATLPDGQSCDDADLCTQTDTCASGACVGDAVPATGCAGADTGTLTLKSLGGTKDKLVWIWKKGDEVLLADIPPQPYSFCLYEGGASALVESLDVPGPPDGPDHTFKETPKKTVYTSKTTAHDGIKTILLKAADAGKSVAKLKAQGANLPTPVLPLQTPVVAQLHGKNGTCFESVYSAPSRNDLLLFRSKAD